jgi:hypothetical protein
MVLTIFRCQNTSGTKKAQNCAISDIKSATVLWGQFLANYSPRRLFDDCSCLTTLAHAFTSRHFFDNFAVVLLDHFPGVDRKVFFCPSMSLLERPVLADCITIPFLWLSSFLAKLLQ